LNVSSIKEYQDMGIDRLLTRPDGSVVTVEYKFDLAASRTGNIFFETVSVDRRNIPGWGWSSQADYWIFLLNTNEILVVIPSRFRALVWELRFEIVEKKIQNSNYNTIGIPIPLKKVQEISSYQTRIESV
jgi:hypothetical protein